MTTQNRNRKSGLRVSALGLGAMGMSSSYGETNDDESDRKLIPSRTSIWRESFIDTADMWLARGHNERVGLSCHCDSSRLGGCSATKFGNVRDRTANAWASTVPRVRKGRRAGCKLEAASESVSPGSPQHRVDPSTRRERLWAPCLGSLRRAKLLFWGCPSSGFRNHPSRPMV